MKFMLLILLNSHFDVELSCLFIWTGFLKHNSQGAATIHADKETNWKRTCQRAKTTKLKKYLPFTLVLSIQLEP
jgi:hypothetical protein